PCNLDSDENEAADVVRMVRDHLPRNWRTLTKVDAIEGFVFDDRDPKAFDAYPPVKADKKLRVIVSAPFEAYGTIGASTESKLPAIYDTLKVEWALYRCMSRDNSPLAARATTHLNTFETLLGIKRTRDQSASPKAGHERV